MKAMNELERKVLEMLKQGKKLHGLAREIAIEIAQREQEQEEKN